MKKEHACKIPIDPRYGIAGLSWSSLLAIEQDVHKWLAGIKQPMKPTEAMRFGTYVHKNIKKLKLPHGDHPEEPIICIIPISRTKTLTIFGTPDDWSDGFIDEYKSAKKLWNRKKADEHGQLFTYALIIWKNTGKLITHARLTSIETGYKVTCGDREIILTGNTQTILVPITMLDVLKIQARFLRAYKKVMTAMSQN